LQESELGYEVQADELNNDPFVEVTMRSGTVVTRFICGAAFLWTLGWGSPAHAQIGVGEWVRTDAAGKGMTMTVAPCCKGGYRLTYSVLIGNGQQPPLILTVDLPMDGTEVPVLAAGKPSGQTMSAKRIDDHHYTAVVKLNGQPSLTSNATLSADGKSMTIEDTMAGNQKVIETWVKK
jgi:hypothetical protein